MDPRRTLQVSLVVGAVVAILLALTGVFSPARAAESAPPGLLQSGVSLRPAAW